MLQNMTENLWFVTANLTYWVSSACECEHASTC